MSKIIRCMAAFSSSHSTNLKTETEKQELGFGEDQNGKLDLPLANPFYNL